MRIVAGQFRGRALFVPDTKDTRPTMDKTRQAIFNILRSASWAMRENGEPVLNDARVMDVFAGSGAMGFEAISQGAQSCVFVENSKLAQDAILKNIDKIGLKDKARLLPKDALKLPEKSDKIFDMVFMDPPYGDGLLIPAITALKDKKYVDSKTLLVLEMQKKESLPDEAGIVVLDTRQYGVSKNVFAKLA